MQSIGGYDPHQRAHPHPNMEYQMPSFGILVPPSGSTVPVPTGSNDHYNYHYPGTNHTPEHGNEHSPTTGATFWGQGDGVLHTAYGGTTAMNGSAYYDPRKWENHGHYPDKGYYHHTNIAPSNYAPECTQTDLGSERVLSPNGLPPYQTPSYAQEEFSKLHGRDAAQVFDSLPAGQRMPFDWINKHPFTTAQPPGKEGKTRTKDKYRVVYSDHQRLELEKEFRFSRYITIRRKSELALQLNLSERQIKIWFQNRRAKERKINKKHMANGKQNDAGESQNGDCDSPQTDEKQDEDEPTFATDPNNNTELMQNNVVNMLDHGATSNSPQYEYIGGGVQSDAAPYFRNDIGHMESAIELPS